LSVPLIGLADLARVKETLHGSNSQSRCEFLEIRRAIRCVGTDVAPAMSRSPEFFILAEGLDR
jgi:hypothetical protein